MNLLTVPTAPIGTRLSKTKLTVLIWAAIKVAQLSGVLKDVHIPDGMVDGVADLVLALAALFFRDAVPAQPTS